MKIVSEIDSGLHAPTKIPKDIKMIKEEAAPSSAYGVAGMQGMGSGSGGGVAGWPVCRAERECAGGPEGGCEADRAGSASPAERSPAWRFRKPDPIYPPIAKAAHVQGAVILHAIISKQGTIEKLSSRQRTADAGQRRPGCGSSAGAISPIC